MNRLSFQKLYPLTRQVLASVSLEFQIISIISQVSLHLTPVQLLCLYIHISVSNMLAHFTRVKRRKVELELQPAILRNIEASLNNHSPISSVITSQMIRHYRYGAPISDETLRLSCSCFSVHFDVILGNMWPCFETLKNSSGLQSGSFLLGSGWSGKRGQFPPDSVKCTAFFWVAERAFLHRGFSWRRNFWNILAFTEEKNSILYTNNLPIFLPSTFDILKWKCLRFLLLISISDLELKLTFSLSVCRDSDGFSRGRRVSWGVGRSGSVTPTWPIPVNPQHARECGYLFSFVVVSTKRLK